MSDMRRSTGQISRWPHRRKPLSFGAAILILQRRIDVPLRESFLRQGLLQ